MRLKEVQQGKLGRERSLVWPIESNLQPREVALRQLQAGARERQDSAPSWDRESQGAFLETPLLTENLQGKAYRDSSTRERRLMQGRIHGWQQEHAGGQRHGTSADQTPEGVDPTLNAEQGPPGAGASWIQDSVGMEGREHRARTPVSCSPHAQ